MDLKGYNLFSSKRFLLSESNLKKLKDAVKKDFDKPEKDKKVYIISSRLDEDSKHYFTINCSQYTITKSLALIVREDDMFQSFVWKKSEIEKYPITEDIIFKIIKALKDDSISFEKDYIPIKEVL